MKDRRIILAVLVAGIFLLLPVIAAAHLGLKGICSNCHTMHASQDGITTTPNNQLLKFNNCVACHAGPGWANDPVTGRSTTGIPAPQVHDSANPIAGGNFTLAGADSIQHNVYDLGLSIDAAFTFIPGSGTPYNAGSQVTCESCHDRTIGHQIADAARSGTSTSSYRMLGRGGGFYVSGTGDTNYEVAAGQNTYNATSLNLFCASCHGLFHGLNQGVGEDPVPNVWLRHPTDVSLAKEYPAATFTGNNTIPMGGDGTDTDLVMCVSCHRPHGSPQADMLRFSYSTVLAGDGSSASGCEVCHGVM